MAGNEEYLVHYGILGMKWGVRRFQNPDGTLTDEGKKRYYYNEWKNDRKWNNEKGARSLADMKYFGEQYHIHTDKELTKAKHGRKDALNFATQKEREYNKLKDNINREAYKNAKKCT